ncbi:uncharacterized protein LOC131594194 [Vicia villosa]|uniref:uncharacterized protein LOC131594194 n=1 Tax=Vicia villosa TaxID=3911 RepID=UPI00273CEEBE|nr:uncharacterized protein LOC131594194 [Vicia villosa]
MTILLFDGEEDAYWWILCLEKFFKEHETPKSLKVLKAVRALRGSAFKWWIWWSRVHRRYNWELFTTALLWRFKPEWREILPISDEEEEPIEEDEEWEVEPQQLVQGDNIDVQPTMVDERINDSNKFSSSRVISDLDFALSVKDPIVQSPVPEEIPLHTPLFVESDNQYEENTIQPYELITTSLDIFSAVGGEQKDLIDTACKEKCMDHSSCFTLVTFPPAFAFPSMKETMNTTSTTSPQHSVSLFDPGGYFKLQESWIANRALLPSPKPPYQNDTQWLIYLIKFYANFSCMYSAQKVFAEMSEQSIVSCLTFIQRVFTSNTYGWEGYTSLSLDLWNIYEIDTIFPAYILEQNQGDGEISVLYAVILVCAIRGFHYKQWDPGVLFWKYFMCKEKAKIMVKWATLIEQNIEDVAALDTIDGGKLYSWCKAVHVPEETNILRCYAGADDKILGKVFKTSRNLHLYTLMEHIGVVGHIIPWIFPIAMFFTKVAPSLAAGCTMVPKPAEQTPLSSLFYAYLANEVGIPNGVLNVVPGFGATAGAAITSHMDIDAIRFTGSTETGRRIMQADECLMTRMQDMYLGYHFLLEQEFGSLTHAFFGFNSTIVVWRISPLNEVGGWKDHTTVEDMDLAVRASLKGWKFVYFSDLKVKSELPSTFKAYCYQQHRWSCGLANLFKEMTMEIIRNKKVTMWKKFYVVYSFFFMGKIIAHVVTFTFYCVILLATVLVPEVEVLKWGVVYIPSIITLLNAVESPYMRKLIFQIMKYMSQIISDNLLFKQWDPGTISLLVY